MTASALEFYRVVEDPAYWPAPQVDDAVAGGEREVAENRAARSLKTRSVALTPQLHAKLLEYFKLGEGGRNWYVTLYQDFLTLLGNTLDAEMMIKLIAATSPRMSPEVNILCAAKAFALWKLNPDAELPCYDYRLPEDGFRGFMRGHCGNLNRVRRGERLEGLKVQAFVDAMFGDTSAVVVDTWMLRASGLEPYLSVAAEITLIDDSKVSVSCARMRQRKGYEIRYRGTKMDIPVYSASGMPLHSVFKIPELRPGVYFYSDQIIKKITRHTPEILDTLYRGLASMYTRFANSIQMPPRDCQAAIWTGIKMLNDPVGLNNFVFYYHKHFGDQPFSDDVLQRIAVTADFVSIKTVAAEGPVETEVEVGALETDLEQTVSEAANMLA